MIPDSRIWRTIGAGARQAAAWPFRVAAARATLKALANMDRRELADIGLNPSDVRDASALPLDRDPTELLARRARERLSGRPHLELGAGPTTCLGAARRHRGRDRSRPGRKPVSSEQAELPAGRAWDDGRLAEQVGAQRPRSLAEAEPARGHLEPTPYHPGVGA
jgi:uncharacterized protein YjiS (DUF1127 family)